MEILTRNEQETGAFAHNYAKELENGAVLFLHGDLGMGKSVFARALIRALCGDEHMEVPSPTFTLVQTYDFMKAGEEQIIWHFDLYRLSDPQDIYEIGWEEAMAGGIVLVEWPERLGALVPSSRTDITLSPVPGEPDHRIIRIEKT